MSDGNMKTIDYNLVTRLAARGYVTTEIAMYANISESTLFRRCSDALDRGYTLRNASLRKKQFDLAMNGNATMLVWLGKNLLGQTDRHELTGPAGGPIQVENVDLTKLSDEELKQLENLIEKAHNEAPEPRASKD